MWLHGKYGFRNQSTRFLERLGFFVKDLGCSPVSFSDIWPQHKSPLKVLDFIKRITKHVLFGSVRFTLPRFGIPDVTLSPQKMQRGLSQCKIHFSLVAAPLFSISTRPCVSNIPTLFSGLLLTSYISSLLDVSLVVFF